MTNAPQKECVFLKPGGVLKRIDIPEYSEPGVFEETDNISYKIPHFLMNECEVHPDCTFRDIFLLIMKNMKLCELIIGNWVDQFIEEAFIPDKNHVETEIEYLELYRYIEIDRFASAGLTNEIEGLTICNFHGVGFELTEEQDGFKPGSRIPYAIEFTPVNRLIDLPFRLSKTMEITKTNFNDNKEDRQKFTAYNVSYTLYEVLYWPIWEISFMGSPEMRDEKSKEIFDRAEECEKDICNPDINIESEIKKCLKDE